MFERQIDIERPDGAMGTFITHPEEGGPHPVVLFLMDAPGKREELHDMARRIASAGYYVMLPNLYYRRTPDFTVDGTPESREVMFGHMNSLSNAMVTDDCEALLSTAADDAAAGEGPVGCVGYCMSGPFAIYAAGALSGRIRAAASIHGVRLLTDADDSPHRIAPQARGELYIGCAETDDWAPPSMVDALDEHLTASIDPDAEPAWRIEWYPDTEHGFVFPDRVGKYDKAAAERHWERLLAMFARQLR